VLRGREELRVDEMIDATELESVLTMRPGDGV